MVVNQIAVFLENKQGRIYDFAKVISEAKIDLVSMSIADTEEFGILRAVTSDNKKAVEALKKAGFTVISTDMIGIEIPDVPGSLAKVLKIMSEEKIQIEYLYSYARSEANKAYIILKVADNEKTVQLLNKRGVKVVSDFK